MVAFQPSSRLLAAVPIQSPVRDPVSKDAVPSFFFYHTLGNGMQWSVPNGSGHRQHGGSMGTSKGHALTAPESQIDGEREGNTIAFVAPSFVCSLRAWS